MSTSPSLLPISTIPTRPLHWLWPTRIPFAHLTILYGQPGTGLSLTALHLAASVSTGRTLPDGLPCPQGNVLLVSPFDSPAHTITPRLENAAADTDHIFLLNTVPDSSPTPTSNPPSSTPSSPSSPSPTERPFSLAHDFALLEDSIQHTSARLVIIDSPDLCREQLLRSHLPRLTHLAQYTSAAILLVLPLTKPLSIPLRPASLHTLPLISSVHSALLLIPDPDDDQERILLTIKHSLSTPTPPLACTISPQPSGIPTLHWLGDYIGSVLSSPDSEDINNKRSQVCQHILNFMRLFPDPLDAKALSSLVPATYDTIRKTLQRMLHSGDIISPARGLYTLPSSSKPSPDSPVPTVPTLSTTPSSDTSAPIVSTSSTNSSFVPTVPIVSDTPAFPPPTFATSFIPIDPFTNPSVPTESLHQGVRNCTSG